jgi:hypothetical protein
MKYKDTPLKYVVQTDQTFYSRYKEYTCTQKFRNNNANSEYSNHILSIGHACGNLFDAMNRIKTEKKRNTPKYIRKMP